MVLVRLERNLLFPATWFVFSANCLFSLILYSKRTKTTDFLLPIDGFRIMRMAFRLGLVRTQCSLSFIYRDTLFPLFLSRNHGSLTVFTSYGLLFIGFWVGYNGTFFNFRDAICLFRLFSSPKYAKIRFCISFLFFVQNGSIREQIIMRDVFPVFPFVISLFWSILLLSRKFEINEEPCNLSRISVDIDWCLLILIAVSSDVHKNDDAVLLRNDFASIIGMSEYAGELYFG